MDLKNKATRGGAWFAITSFAGQGISWAFTFYVIRILDPEDFGLMTMASLLTAYLQMFSELGMGAAIIQRSDIDQRSLSSIFWLALVIGTLMGGLTLLLAYPTAWIFSNNELIPVTQLISLLFLIGALSTVPYHLLVRQFEFKKIGTINLVSTLFSGLLSVVLARNGYGVFTLIWANIALNGLKAILFFLCNDWRPSATYSATAVKPFLRYGIVMALSGTSLRLFQTLDRLVIGKFFGAFQTGLYGNAITISSIPLDKIWPIFQQILFPLFSRLKDEREKCIEVYLGTLKNYLLLVSPIYLGGAFAANELILTVLGEKWLLLSPIFQLFCIVKLFQVLASYQTLLENTTGRHKSALFFNLSAAIIIPGAMWAGAQLSFHAALMPWVFLYPILCCGWIIWSLKRNLIQMKQYFRAIFEGTMAAWIMLAGLFCYAAFAPASMIPANHLTRLLLYAGIGSFIFVGAILLFQRPLLTETFNTLKTRSIRENEDQGSPIDPAAIT